MSAAHWIELLPRVQVQPDTRHRFLVAPTEPVTHVRLEVFPDGGLARLRVLGEITPDAAASLRARYQAVRHRGGLMSKTPTSNPLTVKSPMTWLKDVASHDYQAAHNYLSLKLDDDQAGDMVARLKKAKADLAARQ